TLTISRVWASCGCTTTALAKTSLASGESVELDAILNTAELSGGIHNKNIYIDSNDPMNPTLTLRITGSVEQGKKMQKYHIPAEDLSYWFYMLIDLRDQQDFAGGHLIGAINVPLSKLEDWINPLPRETLIILYDQDGSLSDEAAQDLNIGGFSNAKSLFGGLNEWMRRLDDKFLLSPTAGKEAEIVYFYENGCPHCLRIDALLQRMQETYGELAIVRYEIHAEGSIKLLQQLEQLYGISVEEIPVVFINDGAFQGAGRAVEYNIEQAVRIAIDEGSTSPLVRLEQSEISPERVTRKLTIPAVLAAAAVDAVNPCACAVLILLLGTLIAAGKRRRMIGAGFAFTLATYISYFLMGIGLYTAIQATRLQHTIYLVVASIAIIAGLWNMKDYLWYGRWFTIEVPTSWQPTLKRITSSVASVPGAFAIGFLVSLFLLPCTSGPYIIILGLLAETTTRNYAFLLLLLYNFIFVLPFVIITLGIAFGFTTTARAERWRQERLGKLHLITGGVMVLLGIAMLVSMQFGVM
ncbi:DUF1573 domain-containing protein, partial [Candidatus Bipolaricaulota bacterium]|nr:DUF1573 domain-containing protein [Candidatus Bipolaricaulota bacterium]